MFVKLALVWIKFLGTICHKVQIPVKLKCQNLLNRNYMFNRPGEAGAVRQIPLYIIHEITHSLTQLSFVKLYRVSLHDNRPSTKPATPLRPKRPIYIYIYMTFDLWQVTCDTWLVTCDMWHITHDIRHVTHVRRWTFSKFQLPNSKGF